MQKYCYETAVKTLKFVQFAGTVPALFQRHENSYSECYKLRLNGL
jgi:hypothetical protein